jgi:predicted ATPase
LPPTVQGIFASRIDRQPSEHKRLLQTLAVIGREAPFSLIRQVASTTEGRLENMLADLQTSEFIYEQPMLADVEYVFKHALTQEVAYNSLLIERRKTIHEQTGDAISSMFREHLDDYLMELAHHYSRSANMSKAIEHLRLAGQQAIRRSAHRAAIVHLSTAMDILGSLPDKDEHTHTELDLQTALGTATMAVKGYGAPEVQNAFSRALELCKEPARLFPILSGMLRFGQSNVPPRRELTGSGYVS